MTSLETWPQSTVEHELRLKEYQVALETVREVAHQSRILDYDYIGRSNHLLIKDETEQTIGSFKIRGAYNKMRSLEPGTAVVAASAGNHAQGVALAAATLEMPATIFIPADAPDCKKDAIRYFGGDFVSLNLDAKTYDEAQQLAENFADLHNATPVHPFDDDAVIHGQGTIGLEILAQVPDVHRIFVPIGGGGLAAGVAEAVKLQNPDVSIVGVQLKGSDSAQRSLQNGFLTPASAPNDLSDGTKVGLVGEKTFARIANYVDEIMVISEIDLGAELFTWLNIAEELRPVYGSTADDVIPEAAGALSLAGAKVYAQQYPDLHGETWVAIKSGRNFDESKLNRLIEKWHDDKVCSELDSCVAAATITH
ncbi:MAG TPA: pyridoxal-phosphate dependent enzyme [Candidatus Saccharimonadales bacterium]|jgi:threonine dehydratase|nr:pyridoxal-phosphate dependent enzyme [Candidatus Saccharimonadales bacterium]